MGEKDIDYLELTHKLSTWAAKKSPISEFDNYEYLGVIYLLIKEAIEKYDQTRGTTPLKWIIYKTKKSWLRYRENYFRKNNLLDYRQNHKHSLFRENGEEVDYNFYGTVKFEGTNHVDTYDNTGKEIEQRTLYDLLFKNYRKILNEDEIKALDVYRNNKYDSTVNKGWYIRRLHSIKEKIFNHESLLVGNSTKVIIGTGLDGTVFTLSYAYN